MTELCNNCIRGIAIDTKDVCKVCGGTGFKTVEAVKEKVADIKKEVVPKAKMLVHKKGK